MANRIALIVKGLPDVPLDEMANRFGQYYKRPARGVFHSSQSFPEGKSSGGSISFTDINGGYSGGGGLTKQSIGDLRRLEKDFQSFIADNPAIYTNNPTTVSRGRLYKRQGFVGNGTQVLDARRIAESDLPYTQALDNVMLSKNIQETLGTPNANAFFRLGDGTIRSIKRFDSFDLSGLLSGKLTRPDYILNQMVDRAMEVRAIKRENPSNWEEVLRERRAYKPIATTNATPRTNTQRLEPITLTSITINPPPSLISDMPLSPSPRPTRPRQEMDFRTLEEMRLGLPPVGIEEYRRRRAAAQATT